MTSRAWTFTCIMVLGLLVRAALLAGRLWFGPPLLANGDELDYHTRAVNLVVHGVYSRQQEPPFLPDSARVPGLPIFLSVLYRLVGTNPRVALIVMGLLNAATVGLVLWIASSLFGYRVGFWAGLLLAVDVNHALSATELMTETLGTIGALFATWVMVRGWRDRSAGWLFLSGVLWGLTALTRSTFVWVIGPVIVALAVGHWRHWGAFAKAAGPVFVGIILAVGPWMVRNHLAFGTPLSSPVLASEAGVGMYLYNGAILEGALTGQTHKEARESLRQRLAGKLESADLRDACNDKVMRAEAIKLFLAHPGLAVRLQLTGMVKTFLAPNRERLGRALPNKGIWTKLWMPTTVLWWLTVLLALFGIPRLFRLDKATCVFFVLLAIYIATLASMQGQGRFRVPIDPQICMLAGMGVASLLGSGKVRPPSETAESTP